MNGKSSRRKQSGQLSIVTVCRCLAISFASCLLFLVVGVFTVNVVMHPERYIQVSPPPVSDLEMTGGESAQDPNWDGALTGVGIGWGYGEYAPFVGRPVMAVLGGIIGYQLDKSV